MCYMSCAIFVSNQLNVYIHHEDKINMHYYISHPHIQCYPLQKNCQWLIITQMDI